MNLSDYLQAGYVPICGCRKDIALEWVEGDTRYNGENIEVNIGDVDDPLWVPSKYYWEDGMLFKKEE